MIMKYLILLLFITGCSVEARIPFNHYKDEVVYSKVDNTQLIIKDYNRKTNLYKLEVDTTANKICFRNKKLQNWTLYLREEEFK